VGGQLSRLQHAPSYVWLCEVKAVALHGRYIYIIVELTVEDGIYGEDKRISLTEHS